MSIKDKYSVKTTTFEQCKEWLLYKHYAKRIPPIQYAFGLFNDIEMVGVLTYGTPVSNNLRSLFSPDYSMLELNRLCVNEGMENNALSFFVSQTLLMLKKPVVVVSYADTSQNHHGYIYQATNFTYTGLSAKRTDWKIKGMEHLHGASIADISRGKENRAAYMRDKYGEDFYLMDRPRKHRYFYFCGNKSQKKKMINMMPYKVMPYPKGDNKRYDASYTPTVQSRLF